MKYSNVRHSNDFFEKTKFFQDHQKKDEFEPSFKAYIKTYPKI